MELICYLSNGYPSIEDSIKLAQNYVEAGCDIIEIDFPARDPYLESPYLADRMKQALVACNDYGEYMNGMALLKNLLPGTKFILLAYEDTIKEIGYERFISFCKEHGFMDLIMVGLGDGEIKAGLMAEGIRVSCYVQFHMLPEEVESAKASNGFVYMQGKSDKVNPEFPELKDCIAHLRSLGINRPIYCGVGIHTPEDATMAREAGADGIFIGSAVLKLQDDQAAMMSKVREFKEKCDE